MQNYGGSHKRFAFLLRGYPGVGVCLLFAQVFRCARLNASGLQGLRGDELIGRLAKLFQEYKGKDSVRLVWGHEGWADSFAGVPLDGNCISVVTSCPREERKRHLCEPSRDQRTRMLNAAHILTAIWKLNGSRFLQKMEERRDAAYFVDSLWEDEPAEISGDDEGTQERRAYFEWLLEARGT